MNKSQAENTGSEAQLSSRILSSRLPGLFNVTEGRGEESGSRHNWLEFTENSLLELCFHWLDESERRPYVLNEFARI